MTLWCRRSSHLRPRPLATINKQHPAPSGIRHISIMILRTQKALILVEAGGSFTVVARLVPAFAVMTYDLLLQCDRGEAGDLSCGQVIALETADFGNNNKSAKVELLWLAIASKEGGVCTARRGWERGRGGTHVRRRVKLTLHRKRDQ